LVDKGHGEVSTARIFAKAESQAVNSFIAGYPLTVIEKPLSLFELHAGIGRVANKAKNVNGSSKQLMLITVATTSCATAGATPIRRSLSPAQVRGLGQVWRDQGIAPTA
jgi:hypothetical protein